MSPSPPGPSLPDPATAGVPSGPRCPACLGTGFRVIERPEMGRSYARPCECRAAGRTEELLKQARIPRRYADCDFASFADLNPLLNAGRSVTRAFVDEYALRKVREEGELGLLFLGPPGVGKTHLAVAALRSLIREHGVVGLFADFRDMMKEIQASYNPVSETSEMDVLRPLLQADVLVLDDLGVCRMTEWVRDTVGHIINVRYNERRVTLITTNLDDDAQEKRKPGAGAPQGDLDPRLERKLAGRPSLADRIGPEIRSRLYEMCNPVRLEGEDYRRAVKESGRRRPSARH